MDEMKITENIIEALETSKKAVPSEAFVTRMENIALTYTAKVSSFSKQTLMGIAASFLLLMVSNIYAISKYNQQDYTIEQTVENDSYNLVPTKSLYK